ncbi:MAG: MFS transporter [Desulfosporosinus sp.]|nr:MFS transporter [Desulfosporosinus sp.]
MNIPAFHLQASQLAMVLQVSFLTNAILGVPAGILADRFGVKSVVAAGLVLTVISSFGRLTASSFGILFVWMFILGVGPAFLNANAAKILGDWFPPQQMGMAMGIYIAGANTGITIALATSAFFSSLKGAFMTSAVIILVASSLTISFIIGTIIGPIISEKVGLMKPFLAPIAIIAAICSYLA